jgi:hypothetical protein
LTHQAKNDFPERIIIRCREIKGKLFYQTVPFKPGMVLERAGRKYQVDEHGTQRRIQ